MLQIRTGTSMSPKYDVPVSATITSCGRKMPATRGQNHSCVITSVGMGGTGCSKRGTVSAKARSLKCSSAAASFGRRPFIPTPW
jgi:hypothetical protein